MTIPILGQPKVRSLFSTAVLNCICDAQYALLLQGRGNIAKCPECRREYAITWEGGVKVAQVVTNGTES